MEFEKNLSKIKDAINLAGEKTGSFVSQQKVKLDLSIANNELNKLYRDLGEKYFESFKDDCNDGFAAETIEKIKKKSAEIAELKEKINNLK